MSTQPIIEVNSYMREALGRLAVRGKRRIPYLPVSTNIKPGYVTHATARRLVEADLATYVGSSDTQIMITASGREWADEHLGE